MRDRLQRVNTGRTRQWPCGSPVQLQYAAQFTLVEPDIDAVSAQCLANLLGSLRIL
jgi:hypothetical protein